MLMWSVCLLCATACDGSPVRPARAEAPASSEGKRAVLVELFTSQGCSSCPPADAVLARLGRDARAEVEVIPLSFHVDYWDYLGWKDPFSSPRFSERQRWYASIEGRSGVYTPQMIVDGGRGFVGSKETMAREAVARAAKLAQPLRLELRVDADGSVHYRARGEASGAELHLILAQDYARNAVHRGENAGKTLQHVGVVRELETRKYEETESGRWHPKLASKLNDAFFVAFVQERSSARVLGAVRTR